MMCVLVSKMSVMITLPCAVNSIDSLEHSVKELKDTLQQHEADKQRDANTISKMSKQITEMADEMHKTKTHLWSMEGDDLSVVDESSLVERLESLEKCQRVIHVSVPMMM
jgi:glutamate racemase